MNKLLPCKGCLVLYNNSKYFVEDTDDYLVSISKALLRQGNHPDKHWVSCEKVSCGFRAGMEVRHIPPSTVFRSLGNGVIHQAKKIGEREQVLVEFYDTNKMYWLPYEYLQLKGGASTLFKQGHFTQHTKEFKLKCLAYAIELWNENTGSLSTFEIDPLPHQIHVVYQILASGDLNWLIADDVGLGKTIEVGLLLSALKQRKQLNKVLIVTPSGLTRQWREEMKNRFSINDFRVYGEHFTVESKEDWSRYPWVIASMDKLKLDKGLDDISLSEGWDIIVFDEAHRLTRREYGNKIESSQRFRLASKLRTKTDSMVLLTATPHQGKEDQFRGLLDLLRPKWKHLFRTLELNPDILKYFIIRNNKSDVTDANGNFIFKGKKVKTYVVPEDNIMKEFDSNLRAYLKKGYNAELRLGKQGVAIGFVMAIYRKLASSSIAAINSALTKRLCRLSSPQTKHIDDYNIDDYRFENENDDQYTTISNEFFAGESDNLKQLIEFSEKIIENDLKLKFLLNDVLPSLLSGNKNEKILIFTEYRVTQDYLKKHIENKFGNNTCTLINGSMGYLEREDSIAKFEENAHFMISTEAGGEGINLQRKCHIIINYDLPWNPSRLLQRVGRLYRYGQEHIVLVLNIKSKNTFDETIIGTLYEKIEQVVQDMQSVSDEFDKGWAEELLGEFIYAGDLEEIILEASNSDISRSEERINIALQKARTAAERQKDIFRFATSYDPSAMQHDINIGTKQLAYFVENMLPYVGAEILQRKWKEQVLTIQVPSELSKELGIRTKIDITFDRHLASNRSTIHMMDLESPLLKFLIKKAKESHHGLAVGSSGVDGHSIVAAVLRWQNSVGHRARQEFCIMTIEKDGTTNLNGESVRTWLTQPSESFKIDKDIVEMKPYHEAVQRAFDVHLAKISNENLHPLAAHWVATALINNI